MLEGGAPSPPEVRAALTEQCSPTQPRITQMTQMRNPAANADPWSKKPGIEPRNTQTTRKPGMNPRSDFPRISRILRFIAAQPLLRIVQCLRDHDLREGVGGAVFREP
jgi:hypothetical protein